jgi:phosphotransferase system HPr (HPr) family protein
MVTKKANIKNELGIHVRPSGLIIQETQNYSGKITLKSKGMELVLSSIMDLLALGLQAGDDLEIHIEGPEEETFIKKITELFETKFDFPPR